jgi:predicted nucleic acid-binding Zn ribbon protein
MDAKGNCDNIDWDIMKMVAGLDAKLHKTHSVYMYCRDADITMHITDGGNDLKGVVNVVFQGNIASRHLDSLRTLAYNSNIICAAGNTTLMTRIYTVCEFIKEMGYYVIDSREVMYNVEE